MGAGTNILSGGLVRPGRFWASSSMGVGAGRVCHVRLRLRLGLAGAPAVMKLSMAGFSLSVTNLMRSGVGWAFEWRYEQLLSLQMPSIL